MLHDIDLPPRPRRGVHGIEDDYDCIKFSDPFVLLRLTALLIFTGIGSSYYTFILHGLSNTTPGLCPNRVSFSKALPRGRFIVVDHVRFSNSFPWHYYALHVVQKKRSEFSYNPLVPGTVELVKIS